MRPKNKLSLMSRILNTKHACLLLGLAALSSSSIYAQTFHDISLSNESNMGLFTAQQIIQFQKTSGVGADIARLDVGYYTNGDCGVLLGATSLEANGGVGLWILTQNQIFGINAAAMHGIFVQHIGGTISNTRSIKVAFNSSLGGLPDFQTPYCGINATECCIKNVQCDGTTCVSSDTIPVQTFVMG